MTHISAVRFHAVSGRSVFFAKSAYCLLTSTSHWTKCHLHSPPVVYKFSPASGYFRSFNPPLPVPFSSPHTHTLATHYTVWHLTHPSLEPFTSSPPGRCIVHAS